MCPTPKILIYTCHRATKPMPQRKITHATRKTPCATTKPNKQTHFFKEKKKNTPSEGGSRDWGDTSTGKE